MDDTCSLIHVKQHLSMVETLCETLDKSHFGQSYLSTIGSLWLQLCATEFEQYCDGCSHRHYNVLGFF